MTAPPSPGGEDLAIPDAPLPVSILTGFLGSGKTTLLRYLLGRPGMAQTAVIVNEFGEIGLDHLLVEKIDDNAVLLNSGCLCCTVRGDLVEAMRRLFKQRVRREIPPFERLVIETTGLADPAPVLQTMMSDPLIASRFRLDGVVTTVDGLLGDASLERHLESVKQAAVADRTRPAARRRRASCPAAQAQSGGVHPRGGGRPDRAGGAVRCRPLQPANRIARSRALVEGGGLRSRRTWGP
jgi:hypothetical protein